MRRCSWVCQQRVLFCRPILDYQKRLIMLYISSDNLSGDHIISFDNGLMVNFSSAMKSEDMAAAWQSISHLHNTTESRLLRASLGPKGLMNRWILVQSCFYPTKFVHLYYTRHDSVFWFPLIYVCTSFGTQWPLGTVPNLVWSPHWPCIELSGLQNSWRLCYLLGVPRFPPHLDMYPGPG